MKLTPFGGRWGRRFFLRRKMIQGQNSTGVIIRLHDNRDK